MFMGYSNKNQLVLLYTEKHGIIYKTTGCERDVRGDGFFVAESAGEEII